ncbi:MAG: McrC family protein [Acutalibacteraceae bacterium]
MKNITFDFEDYSEISLTDSERAFLQKLYPNYGFSGLIYEINYRIRNSNAQNISTLNETASEELKGISLFTTVGDQIRTQGYVGSIGFSKTVSDETYHITINIHSRFDSDKSSRFLMYIFSKAFNVNGKIFDKLPVNGSKEQTWDLPLMITFIKQLHNALKKGMFRQYQEYEHNDSNVKGRIDFARHLKENMPINGKSNGKICYVTREYTVDNPINRLILRAYACLEKRHRNILRGLVAKDDTVKKGLQILKNEVQGWQTISDKDAVKQANKKIVHNVYKNYEPLRKTSIAILKRMGVNMYISSSNSISGVLINMPHLWEVFLHNEIFTKITGKIGEYKQPKFPIIFDDEGNSKQILKPDFYFASNNKNIVIDAKYKPKWGEYYKDKPWKYAREDIFQVLSYMYVLKCQIGGVLFPINMNKYKTAEQYIIKEYKIHDNIGNNRFMLIPYPVPNTEDAQQFYDSMENSSGEIIKQLQKIIDSVMTTPKRGGMTSGL